MLDNNTPPEVEPRRSALVSIFISTNEQRLRAGWRMVIQTLLMFLVSFCIGIPAFVVPMLLQTPPHALLPPEMNMSEWLTAQAVELLAITISVFIARRFLDKRSIASLGLRWDNQAILDLLVGFLITFIQFMLIYGIMFALGWVQITGYAWHAATLQSVLANTLLVLVLFIMVGWSEELLFRGYHLQTLGSGLNLSWGVILSSGIFGVMHILNPGATWVSNLGIFTAGLFLAFGYLCTKQLWLPIGLHIGWNFFEGVVFGFPVSGLDTFRLIENTITGPQVWTGGAFGPEAGLIILPALFFGMVLVYGYSFLKKSG